MYGRYSVSIWISVWTFKIKTYADKTCMYVNFFASLIPDLKRRRKLIEAVLIFRIMPLRYLIVIVYDLKRIHSNFYWWSKSQMDSVTKCVVRLLPKIFQQQPYLPDCQMKPGVSCLSVVKLAFWLECWN